MNLKIFTLKLRAEAGAQAGRASSHGEGNLGLGPGPGWASVTVSSLLSPTFPSWDIRHGLVAGGEQEENMTVMPGCELSLVHDNVSFCVSFNECQVAERMCSWPGLAWRGAGSQARASATFIFIGSLAGCLGPVSGTDNEDEKCEH